MIEQINKLVNDLNVPDDWKYAIKRHAWELQSLDVGAIAEHMKKCEAGLCQRIGLHLEINSEELCLPI